MMNALPWILLFIGVAIVIAVYLHARYQSARKDDATPAAKRAAKRADREISEVETLAVDVPSQPHSLPALISDDDDEKTAREEVFIILHIRARANEEWSGDKIIQCAVRAGLECGDKNVFECYGDKDEARGRKPVFYIANFVNPGTFDWENMSQFKTKGMSLFMRLPGPCAAADGFEKMLACCGYMADKLGADILNSERAPLTDERLQEMRKICKDFDTE